MSTKSEEITLLLTELQKPIEKLNTFLMQDRVSYELLIADLNSIRAKIEQEMKTYKMIQEQNASAGKIADQVTEAAKSQATGIIEAARKERMEGLQMLEAVKEFCKGIDRKHWAELKDKTKEPAFVAA